MAELNDLNVTDASNTGRFPESQLPSTVNNGARALEGILARGLKDIIDGAVTTAGTSTAYTVASNRTLSAYYDGMTLMVEWNATCGATPTVNVDSIGAKNLYWPGGNQVTTGDLISGARSLIQYDGTNFQVLTGSNIDTDAALTTHEADTSTHGVTTVAGLDESQTFTNKTLTSPVLNGTLTGTAFLDEDAFGSNSAVAVASQQSIKAYVDAAASSVDADGAAASAAAALVSENAAAADAVSTAADAVSTAADVVSCAAFVDTFDDRYLGSKASDPTLDNDGDALTDGALYFNTTANDMRVYDLGTTTWLSLTAGALLAANNLSDVAVAATSLSNIGGIGAATTDTLTNKTIDADGTGNVITNIGSSEVKSEVISGQTEVVVAAGDSIIFSDVDDSGNLKRDTVQGILDLASGGNFNLISTAVASAAATVDITFTPGDSDTFLIELAGVVPASDAVVPWLRTSTDGGSTFDSGASNYQSQLIGAAGSAAAGVQSLDTKIVMGGANYEVGTAAGESMSGWIRIHKPADTALYSSVSWQFQSLNSATQAATVSGGGSRLSAADIDAVQFLFSSGNVESGRFTLYKITHA